MGIEAAFDHGRYAAQQAAAARAQQEIFERHLRESQVAPDHQAGAIEMVCVDGVWQMPPRLEGPR